MWAYESVFYQIYPFGFCGAPEKNDGLTVSRIHKVSDWMDHIKKVGANAIYFTPLFESDAHGYDTRDYQKIDCRLGTNEDFAILCAELHRQGIKVVLDGVFHHVGRGFWAFQDVREHKQNSRWKDWFFLRFDQDSPYHDGFSYECWEGHHDLVKLNLSNPDVQRHLFESVKSWVEEYDIDGLRLDVAYCLDPAFLEALRKVCDQIKPGFFLVGEIIHGDYRQVFGPNRCHSCTNYECYKGLYSSMNDQNLFEIAYSINRQFGHENGGLYQGAHLFSFADNHDVHRLASVLNDPHHIPLVYAILFAMPGIPCIYYGSEWGAKGRKENGSDEMVRPCFGDPEENELFNQIARLTRIRKESKALCHGSYRTLYLNNRQFVFERSGNGERIVIAVNSDDRETEFFVEELSGSAINLRDGQTQDLHHTIRLAPYGWAYWRMIDK
jgi:glycosidase